MNIITDVMIQEEFSCFVGLFFCFVFVSVVIVINYISIRQNFIQKIVLYKRCQNFISLTMESVERWILVIQLSIFLLFFFFFALSNVRIILTVHGVYVPNSNILLHLNYVLISEGFFTTLLFYFSFNFTWCKSSWHGFSQTLQRAPPGRNQSWKISANMKKKKMRKRKQVVI